MKKVAEKVVIPEKIMKKIRKDIHDYLRHGYDFKTFLDNNTYGRWYGKAALRPIWEEVKKSEADGNE